jgi:TRAP-type C4-dicarboxylate transport system permease small subunit
MRVKKAIDRVLEVFLIAIMGAMTITVLWQVASRYVIAAPSPWTDETVRFLFMWVGLLGAAYVTGLRMHLAVDLVPSKLSPTNQKKLNAVIYILVAFFGFVVMFIGGLRLVYITLTLNQIAPTLQVPLGYIYLVVPLSGILITYYSIMNIINYQHPKEEGISEVV